MIDSVKRIIQLLTKREKKVGMLVLILSIGMSLVETIGVASVMPFLAILGDPAIVHENKYLSSFYSYSTQIGFGEIHKFMALLGILCFISILFSSCYRILTIFAINRFTEMRRYTISNKIINSYLKQDYLFFLGHNSGELTKNVTSEVDHLVVSIFRPVFAMIPNLFFVFVLSIVLIYINPYISIITVGIIGSFYYITFFILKSRIEKVGKSLSYHNKRRFFVINQIFGLIKILKLSNNYRKYIEEYKQSAISFSSSISSHLTLSQTPKYIIECLAFGGIIFVVNYYLFRSGGIQNLQLGKILPMLGLYALAVYRMQPAIQSIYRGIFSLSYGRTVIENIFSQIQLSEKENNTNEICSEIKFRNKIVCHNIFFSYPKSKDYVLKNISLTIPFGTSLGIVGMSGSGKSTLVDIIIGMLTPTDGTLHIDGEEINDSVRVSWQKNIGYVPQEVILSDSTIAENIAFAEDRSKINIDQVIACSKLANIHDFISNLPNGYDFNVGESGNSLSGGQKQRVGIARALYNDPDLIIYDEATSSLDLETEKAVLESVQKIAERKTIILISHNPESIAFCDKIILLENGKVKNIKS